MKKVIKIAVTALLGLNAALIAAAVIMLMLTPFINDGIAAETENKLKELPLPEQTEYIESKSKAGKLIGNGNGMQYLAVMLIKSGLSENELREYYSENGCTVKPQEGSEIAIDEYRQLKFRTNVSSDSENSYYLVYKWGSGGGIFAELDLRGH